MESSERLFEVLLNPKQGDSQIPVCHQKSCSGMFVLFPCLGFSFLFFFLSFSSLIFCFCFFMVTLCTVLFLRTGVCFIQAGFVQLQVVFVEWASHVGLFSFKMVSFLCEYLFCNWYLEASIQKIFQKLLILKLVITSCQSIFMDSYAG